MSRRRILLVDDEISGAQVLGMILAEQGYTVTVVGDGRQALARLDEFAPDLLITDFMMPFMNGADLVRVVRAHPAFAQLPVLVISGAPEAALRAYNLDYQAFLRKPFGFDAFVDAVRGLMPESG